MSIRLDRTADIAAVFGARLRSLKMPGLSVWIDTSGEASAFAIRVMPSSRPVTDRTLARFHGLPPKDAIGEGVSDMIVDLCTRVAQKAAEDTSTSGIFIATLDDRGRVNVDHPASRRRVSGEAGDGQPAQYGILEFNAPELFVPGFHSMMQNLASNGVATILIDVGQGTVAYQGGEEPLDEAKREATAPVADIARSFAIQMMISARFVCGTGAAPYEYDDCLILFDVANGKAVLSGKGDSDEGYEIPSMSTALDPARLPPSATLLADIAHSAVLARDLDAYERASEEFSRATGLEPQSLMRYASWIQISEPPAAQ